MGATDRAAESVNRAGQPVPGIDAATWKLLDLVTHPDELERAEYLELACSLAGEPAALIVWLFDREKGRYLLDQSVFLPPRGADEPQDALCRKSVAAPPGDPAGAAPPPLEDEAVTSLLRSKGFSSPPLLFRLSFAGQLIGYAQLFPASAVDDATRERVRFLMDAYAGKVKRSRDARVLDALKRMRAGIDFAKPIEVWFGLAARTLNENIHAEVSLVFRMARDLSLQAVAGGPPGAAEAVTPELLRSYKAQPGSLTHRIAQKSLNVRIADFYDERERLAALGTREYDEKLVAQIESQLSGGLRAWLAAPVMIKNHSVAVIMLLNKESMPEQFSETDQEVLRQVCDFLAGIIPSVETYNAMVKLSKGVLGGLVERQEDRQQLFDLLVEMVPGIACAALSLQTVAQQQPAVTPLGGCEQWFDPHNPPVRPTDGRVVPLGTARRADAVPADPNRSEFVVAIPRLGRTHRVALLCVGLNRNYLSDYECQELMFVCASCSIVLRAQEQAQKQLEEIVQIRHAIRSGLTGVVGQVDQAMSYYQVMRSKDGAEGGRSEFDRAALRKALERAHEYSQKTQAIMEQSRFLLGQVTRESLRIGSHSLGALVREVALGLRTFAERRRLKVHVQNPREGMDIVQMDWGLMDFVVYNLVDNAIKYSHRGRDVVVSVVLERDDWVLQVTDWGVFIQPEHLDAIFEKFTRKPAGQAGTTRPGTGLGLAVAREIVDVHGGQISVESRVVQTGVEPVAETRFTVRVPRRIPLKEELATGR